MKLVSRLLAADSVSLDIGANVGIWTRFLGVLSPQGKVYAFEPSRVTFDLLVANCQGLANVQPLRMALSDVVGRMGFSVDLSSDLRHLGEGELVNVTKLDEWIAASGLERLDFIKLDVEGAEFKVLQGGIKTLRRFIPTILFEYIPENTTWFGGYRRDEMVRMMEGLGYTVRRVTQSGALSEDLERTGDVTNNYLAYASY